MIYQFVVSFLVGIVFEKYFSLGPPFAIFIFLIALILFFYSRLENQSRIFETGAVQSPTLVFLIIGLGLVLGVLRIDLVSNSPNPNFLKFVDQKISFGAVIVNEPDVRDISARYTVKINQNFSSEYSQKCADIFLLENSSCSRQSRSQGISRNIRSKNSDSLILLVTQRFPEYKYGDKIKVSGKLELPKNFTGDNGLSFNYVSYLAKDRIHFLIYQPQVEKLEGFGGNRFLEKLYNLKNIFIQKISNVVPEPNSSLIAGMIFGVKQSLGQELLDDFKKVGLIHIVVLSGYNITIITAGVFWFISIFGKRNLGFVLGAVLILLFALMVGFSATVVRAVIMALISILALFLGRPADALRWLFIAGFFMLLWNPLLLFYDPSFQLSFMATLGLVLFSEIIDKKIISQTIRLVLKVGVPVSFIVAFEKMKMREIISSTLAVQFFILPLLIKMSGFVSIISFLINPLLLPLTPLIMAFGALTGAIGLLPLVGPILSWPFGAVSYILTQIIISITELAANLSLATLQTGSISIWLVLIWHVSYGVLYFKNTR